jgi:septum formation protein
MDAVSYYFLSMFQVKDENAIVLASESTRRVDILRTLGISFSIIPPDIDESKRRDETIRDYADTIVVHKGRVLGKPKSEEEAMEMLTTLQGKWHKVLTGYCILNMSKQACYQDVVETKVFIKDLTRDEIKRYIKTSEPFDKAGSYAIQGRSGYMVKEIKGSYSNVVGLPICEITQILMSLGILS